MQLLFGQSIMGRPILAPPNIPTERRDALRRAMLATLKDPDFQSEAQKLFMDFNPATGAEIEALLAEYKSYPVEIAHKAKVLLQNY
jgi:tripartite-type tricarboxylate transporter receptor subunit TctC